MRNYKAADKSGAPENRGIGSLVRKLDQPSAEVWTQLSRTSRRLEPNKATVAKAIRVARAQNFSKLVNGFRRRFHATSARASRDSKRSEVFKLAKEVARGDKILPLGRDL